MGKAEVVWWRRSQREVGRKWLVKVGSNSEVWAMFQFCSLGLFGSRPLVGENRGILPIFVEVGFEAASMGNREQNIEKARRIG